MIPSRVLQSAKILLNLDYKGRGELRCYSDGRVNLDKGSEDGSGTKRPRDLTIVLASSSNLFLEGIRRILEGEKDIRTVAEASNPKDIEKHIAELKPAFLFIDNRILNLDIKNLLKLIDKKSPDTRVIILGSQKENHSDSINITYITKETGSSELVSIIKSKKADESAPKKPEKTKDRLTKTELKVIELIINGFSNKEIATKLSISEKTVKAHLTSIFMKLNLQNRYQLIVYAKRLRRGTM